MAKNLIIVESPTKVKTISKFLGKNYTVMASVGHLRDLPKSQFGVDVEDNYKPKYISIRGKGDLISKLKKEAKNSDKIYLATDPDREGEAISWHLAELLGIDSNKKTRITFNEITKNAVTSALKSPRTIDMDLVDAQQARRVLDRIVGYKISPLLWKKVRKGLSAGRVQSVATKLICDREKEIEKFVSEEYWTIFAKLNCKDSKTQFTAKFFGNEDGKIDLKNENETNDILSKLNNVDYIVKSIKKSTKVKAPSAPFTTSSLQQEAGKKLGFTAAKTMMVAQQLYEGVDIDKLGSTGLVTYIRTDSTRIADEAAIEASKYIEETFGKDYLPDSPRIYKNKSSAQDAHEAIRPAHMELLPDKIKSSLTSEQYKLYSLIFSRFIASQMASAIYDTVAAEINAGQYIFKANGSTVRFQGFYAIYGDAKDDIDKEDNNKLPVLQQDDVLHLNSLEPKQNFTQPPMRYTEASLIKALEEKGIGRPSTYAPTIATIIARLYIEREKKMLKPTELGKTVNAIMEEHFADIVNVGFTANMENLLDMIAEGKKQWISVIDDFYKPFKITLDKAEKEIDSVTIKDEVTDIICEKCGRRMVIKMGRNGKFIACPGFPECKNSKPIINYAGVKCPKCDGRIIYRTTRKQKKYIQCENVPQCDFMTWDMPTDSVCPECGSFMVKKGSYKNASLRCSNPVCTYESKK